MAIARRLGRSLLCAAYLLSSLAHGQTTTSSLPTDQPPLISPPPGLSNTQLSYLIYDSSGQPYQISEPQQPPSGIITDIIKLLFEDTGVGITPRVTPAKRVKRAMYSGELKDWITYGLRSWEADSVWGDQHLSSVDLFPYHYGLISLQPSDRSHCQAPSTAQLADIEQVERKDVLVIAGFQYGGLKQRLIELQANIIEARNHQHAIALLERGRAELYLGNHYRLNYLYRQTGKDQYRITLEYPLKTTPVTLLMSSQIDEPTKQFIDLKLQRLKSSGAIERILEKYQYFPTPASQTIPCQILPTRSQ